GSDWCGWCIRLKNEVFDQDPFKQKSGDHFILVELDFPRDQSKLSKETKDQNQALGKKYSVQGYPTIILADAQGRPYAQTGYQEGGPEKYLEHLADLRTKREERDAALAAAAKLDGVEKAEALERAIGDFPDAVIDNFYGDIAETILAADPEDTTGFKKTRDYRDSVSAYEDKVEQLFVAKDFDGVRKLADEFLESHNPTGMDRQHILMGKFMAIVEQGDEPGALKLLDDIKAIDPESEIGSQVGMMKERVNAYFEQKAAPQPPDSQ
ncbi:MAG: thioredoxin family protein, partial [Akkermansiaceae bacterium]|nr:thioredoxin family protein [Akkermansiaceae bacterium]